MGDPLSGKKDSELFRREAEYCTYRPITVLISSWNVDANKPSDLHGDADNMDFLHNCLSSVDTPDIIVFGYQEMIDLENKKLTASTLHACVSLLIILKMTQLPFRVDATGEKESGLYVF